MRKRKLYIVTAILPWALSAHAAPIPVTSCGTVIDERGAYILATDLSCTSTAVTVVAENVSLDLDGYTIDYSGSGGLSPGISIRADSAYVKGNGGTINGFNIGILIGMPGQPANNVRIQGVNATNSGNSGIAAGYGSANNHIIGNTATGNIRGFTLFSQSPGNLIKDNTATHNFIGILIEASNRNHILRNTTNYNAREDGNGIGISLRSGASKNVVQGNTANNNLAWGIVSSSSDPQNLPKDNNILVNTAQGNGAWDLADYDSVCTNNWVHNTFATSKSNACIIE